MLTLRSFADADLLAGLIAVVYGALEKTGVLVLGVASPELALGFGVAALARWYARVRKKKAAAAASALAPPVVDETPTPKDGVERTS